MRQSIFLVFLALILAIASIAEDRVPEDLQMVRFAGSEVTPSPAALCVAPTGEVFVAVDMNGSLGKGPGKGEIIRLVDEDADGVADSHTLFATADSARGLISLGQKLWVLHTTYDASTGKASGMDLTLFTDQDWDGVADGPGRTLIRNLSSPESIRSRGTDHSTNGIRMGIDGWIYIAVGDFGFSEARAADGTEMTLLGGGIIRVRPDGSEMELYTKGLRNIYDVAIDPFMNIFTRGNTNDGGGWNVRFIHQIQSANYGYPMLFLNFGQEILPALQDVGGGSGTGALFLNEPGWPEAYNNQPLMADWGRNAVFLHRLTVDGPSFRQVPEQFIDLSQVTDIDVDGSGRMYLGAWDGATYKGSSEEGYVIRVVPNNWSYQPFESLEKENSAFVLSQLQSESSTIRLAAQQELLARSDRSVLSDLMAMARDGDLFEEARVAAIYTYAQLAGPGGIDALLELARIDGLTEFALRAALDRRPWIEESGVTPGRIARYLQSDDPRIKVAATVALGRLGDEAAVPALLGTPYRFPEEKSRTTLPVGEPRLVKGADKLAVFEADIDGYQELYLHSLYYQVGEKSDRSYWVDPRIHLPDGSTVSLLDLEWKSANTAHGPILKRLDIADSGLRLSGKDKKNATSSLSVPLVSTVVYDLPDGAVRFTAKVGLAQPENGVRPEGEFHATPEPVTGISQRIAHATPDPDRILPHLAVHSLVGIGSEKPLLDALESGSPDLAHWAIRYMGSESLVDGVIAHWRSLEYPSERRKTLTTLARLYQKEAPYDGSWWWSTRPDTRGPHYKPVTWAASPRIEKVFLEEWERSDAEDRDFLTALNDSHRMGIDQLGTFLVEEEEEKVDVDLSKIAAKKGAIATTAIEDVILALDKIEGSYELGETLFTQQGCIACHTLNASEASKGPFMGQIGSIMGRDQIAEAILRPNATISQGFQTTMIATTDGKTLVGFVTSRNSDEITLRDITGNALKVAVSEVKSEDHLPTSMMPPGLANSLSLQEFASMVRFLSEQN